MRRRLTFFLAMTFILATGLAHGKLSGRWGSSQVLDDAVGRVVQVPKEFGDWTSKDIEPEVKAFAQAGAVSYWIRVYTNTKTKASVQAILMCGRAGRMAMHTPEVCYPGAGYVMNGSSQAYPVSARADFWTARFTKESALESGAVRLFWAWTSDGTWQAPSSPRWEFSGRPFLYKLYLSRELQRTPPPLENDPGLDFLRQYLPVLDATLFPHEDDR